jgi:hypothetical protein
MGLLWDLQPALGRGCGREEGRRCGSGLEQEIGLDVFMTRSVLCVGRWLFWPASRVGGFLREMSRKIVVVGKDKKNIQTFAQKRL